MSFMKINEYLLYGVYIDDLDGRELDGYMVMVEGPSAMRDGADPYYWVENGQRRKVIYIHPREFVARD